MIKPVLWRPAVDWRLHEAIYCSTHACGASLRSNNLGVMLEDQLVDLFV